MSILRTTAVALCALALAGCEPPEPRVFGVPQSQWNSLNHEQQTKVVDGYNAQQKQKAENEPWLAAIGVDRDRHLVGRLRRICHPGARLCHRTDEINSLP